MATSVMLMRAFPSDPAVVQFRNLYLRIAPDRIAVFRFLLEGYDGLALVSTLDRQSGLIRLRYPRDRYEELVRTVGAFASEYSLALTDHEVQHQL